jgi:ribosome maturation factor RimP
LRAAFFVLVPELPHLIGLEARIAELIAPAVAELGYELVRVAVLGRDRPTVQIMADRADGTLIGVADCEAISRAVSAVLDVDDPIPGAWELEVSSAGIDRPLTRAKDWNRFAGHQAKAELNIPIDGRKRFAGIVLGAEDGQARMRLDDGTEVSLPLTEMRRARLVLTDALIEASARMMKAAQGPGGFPGEEAGDDAPEIEIEAEASPARKSAHGAARAPKPKRKTH